MVSALLAASLLTVSLHAAKGGKSGSDGSGSPNNTQKPDMSSKMTDLDTQLRLLVSSYGLTGNPAIGKDIPSIESQKSQLGMKLFFSKALGGDMDSACASCHHPALGGGDNLSLSIGVGAVNPELLGSGRALSSSALDYDSGYANVPRNAPSTFNVVLWQKALFWDGRIKKVENGISTPDSSFGTADPDAGSSLAVAQARFPITSEAEMKGRVFESGNTNEAVRTHLGLRLSDDTAIDYIRNIWQSEFNDVYGSDSVNIPNIVDAIGEYENSQLFINNPWKQYVEGNNRAISNDAKQGAILFFSSYEEGGASCVSCHSGDFFTDENYHVMAIPQVGLGKGDGDHSDDDFGRIREDTSASKCSFRTPTLLNVEMTGPWGHDGAYKTLEGIVSHMADIDSSVAAYDVSQLDHSVKIDNISSNTQNALTQLHVNRASGLSPHQNVILSTQEISAIVLFLKTLTDPCIKDRSCIGKWIPDTTSDGPDSLQLNAIDSTGDLL